MTRRLQRFLSRHCSTAAMEWLVDPILTDIRIEAAEASLRGRWWAGLWIRCAGLAALFKALVLYGWSQLSRFEQWPDDDRRVLVRTLAYSVDATAAAIPLLMLPRLSAARAPELALYLALEAMTNALPVGLLIGLIYGFEAKVVSLRPRLAFIRSQSFRTRIAFNHRLGLEVPGVEVVY